MAQTFRDIDVLQFKQLPGPANDRLANTFDVYDATATANAESVPAPVRDKIRGLVVSGRNAVPAAMIDGMPKLEIVVCHGAGVDKIDLERCRARGIVVTNCAAACADDVADMGVMLMMSVARGLVTGDRFVRERQWARTDRQRLWVKVSGKTIGIVGLGTIGKAIAKRAVAMGMRVLYNNRRPRADVPYTFVDNVRDLAARCDFLMLSCPGGEATRHLVDATVLGALGRDGFLINVARGTVVDEDALVRALENGTIAGAALDVYATEPNVRAELLGLENVVLSPHAASGTRDTQHAMGQLCVDNLIEFFSGRPALTPV